MANQTRKSFALVGLTPFVSRLGYAVRLVEWVPTLKLVVLSDVEVSESIAPLKHFVDGFFTCFFKCFSLGFEFYDVTMTPGVMYMSLDLNS